MQAPAGLRVERSATESKVVALASRSQDGSDESSQPPSTLDEVRPQLAVVPPSSTSLFRGEALAARQTASLGTILIARPVSATALSLFAVAIASSIIAFLIFGKFTRKETVTGEIQTSLGLAQIHSPQSGFVIKRLVSEGQHVTRGQALFVVSTDHSSVRGETEAAIVQQITLQKNRQLEELRKQRSMLAEEEAELHQRVATSERALAQLNESISVQEKHVALGNESLEQYRTLARQHYFSDAALNDKESDVLDAQAHLSDLKTQQITAQRDLDTLRSDLRNHPLKAANELSSIEREIETLEQNNADAEGRREIVVPAPSDGTVSSIIAEPGQAAAPNMPMASLLPGNSKLEANLYAPSRAVGFMRVGDEVLMRYDAYPYQKFGQYGGKISEISRSAIAPGDLPFTMQTPEPMYRIRVALDSPTITAYGQQQALQSGMRLEADVMIDTRKLWEWVLEPLFSLSGKI